MTMASSSLITLGLLFLVLTTRSAAGEYPPLTLTVVNNCPFTIWPAIQPNAGDAVLECGGFALPTLAYRSFPAPNTHWSGRIWARTDCTSPSPNHLTCYTGDCGGLLQCAGAGGSAPATLAQFTLHHGGDRDLSSYGVSLVDGFNLPVTVTPHEGKGECPVVGCTARLLETCPECLQKRDAGGKVVACKSGCEAFGTDELCCRNGYSGPGTCKASAYSQFFKTACPATFTYAHDSPSLTHDCSAPRELKVIFCH